MMMKHDENKHIFCIKNALKGQTLIFGSPVLYTYVWMDVSNTHHDKLTENIEYMYIFIFM